MDLSHLPLWASLLLLLGFVTRVTRLIVWDSITQPIRTKLGNASWAGATANQDGSINRSRKNKVYAFFAELTSCVWCSSVWVGAFAVLGLQAFGDTTWFNLVTLAASLSFVASWILISEPE